MFTRVQKKQANLAKVKNDVDINIATGGGSAYLKIRFMVLRRDGFKCKYCGRSVKQNVILNIDHVIPKSKGGDYSFENLITSCFECNQGKKDILLTKREMDKLLPPLSRKP